MGHLDHFLCVIYAVDFYIDIKQFFLSMEFRGTDAPGGRLRIGSCFIHASARRPSVAAERTPN
jgi:hypothetical protein